MICIQLLNFEGLNLTNNSVIPYSRKKKNLYAILFLLHCVIFFFNHTLLLLEDI